MTRWKVPALAAVLLCFMSCTLTLTAQDIPLYGTKSSIGLTGGYAWNSSHILIGDTHNRKTTQAGIDYIRDMKRWRHTKLSYEGQVLPLYLESDPTYIGSSTPNLTGPPTIVYFSSPFRPYGLYGDLGFVYLYGPPGPPITEVAVTGIVGPRENTYAFAALPFGTRFTGFTRSRIQPTFAINLGALYGTRNIPVDYTSSFNFLAYAGPGVEVYVDRRHSVRIEYLYEHMSNAGLGAQNPGVDSAAFRVTLAHYR